MLIHSYTLIHRSPRNETHYPQILFADKHLHLYTHFTANLLKNKSCFYDICQSVAAKVPQCGGIWARRVTRWNAKLWRWRAERRPEMFKSLAGREGNMIVQHMKFRLGHNATEHWVIFFQAVCRVGIQTLNHKMIHDSTRLLMDVPKRLREFWTRICTFAQDWNSSSFKEETKTRCGRAARRHQKRALVLTRVRKNSRILHSFEIMNVRLSLFTIGCNSSPAWTWKSRWDFGVKWPFSVKTWHFLGRNWKEYTSVSKYVATKAF